jgi:hypothetical protein
MAETPEQALDTLWAKYRQSVELLRTAPNAYEGAEAIKTMDHYRAAIEAEARANQPALSQTQEVERLRAALTNLSVRHDWSPDLGHCICDAHIEARKLLTPEARRALTAESEGGTDGR